MSARLTGTLEIMPFLDVLYLLYTNNRTGILRLMAPDGRTGSVFLYNGRFLHAETPNANGERALAEIVCWPKGAFSFTENERPAVATITRPADEVLTFISDLYNQWQSVQHIVKDPLAKPAVNPAIQQAVTITPLAWKVLVACDGEQTLYEIAATCGLTDFEMARLLQPLVEVGAISFIASETVSPLLVAPELIEGLVVRLANVLGPVARVLVERTARELQTDVTALPQSMLGTLVTQLSNRITDPHKRNQFLTDVKAYGLL
ncbi:MAG: DUF4388 domain-containing protein [Blastocatellia bacterium]|nr:DUF4388 domain-containing protein [Blastocatellia bacterium]